MSDRLQICSSCGRQFGPEARFCGVDGMALIPLDEGDAPRKPSKTGMKAKLSMPGAKQCILCGQLYPPQAKFCAEDGLPLSNNPIGSAPPREAQAGNSALSNPPPRADDSPTHANPSSLVGQQIAGKYLVEGYLDQGGMAVVFRGMHTAIEKPVVLKVLQRRHLKNESAKKRFDQECKLMAKLNHPNIVSVFDTGVLPAGEPYIVMEYVKGESLRDRIDRFGPLPVNDALTVLIQICAGLAEAHSYGIIHRDLKPENILLKERGNRADWVKIVDFGIAFLKESNMRLTQAGNVVGTPDYMSPEQLRDEPLDLRTDIYALGAILFECLAGRAPFEADNVEQVVVKQLFDKPEAISEFLLDEEAGPLLDILIGKALEKTADKRFQTVDEMRSQLEQILKNLEREKAT